MNRIAIKALNGRVAIVTGGTSGIGFAIAQRLSQEGAKVIISSRKEKNVEEATGKLLSQGLEVRGIVGHISKAANRKKLLDEARRLGGLDILVQAAAANPTPDTQIFDTSESSWDKNFEVNVKASFMFSKEALGMLKESKAGRIIYIGTVLVRSPDRYLGAYCCSKAALSALTKVAAKQLAEHRITVNCIEPGLIKTRFSKVLYENEVKETKWLAAIPLNRIGRPEEIGGIAALLASDDGSYITGESIAVAGGMTL